LYLGLRFQKARVSCEGTINSLDGQALCLRKCHGSMTGMLTAKLRFKTWRPSKGGNSHATPLTQSGARRAAPNQGKMGIVRSRNLMPCRRLAGIGHRVLLFLHHEIMGFLGAKSKPRPNSAGHGQILGPDKGGEKSAISIKRAFFGLGAFWPASPNAEPQRRSDF
jgi:hypothetical protein